MADSFLSTHFPYLPIHIQIGTSSKLSLDVEVLVDTGFGGGVAIPRGTLDLSNLPFMNTKWVLADGSEILTPAYLGYVRIGEFEPVLSAIIVLGDEPLLGRQVLNHFTLILDHGQKIIVKF